jgi:hypothetical protein
MIVTSSIIFQSAIACPTVLRIFLGGTIAFAFLAPVPPLSLLTAATEEDADADADAEEDVEVSVAPWYTTPIPDSTLSALLCCTTGSTAEGSGLVDATHAPPPSSPAPLAAAGAERDVGAVGLRADFTEAVEDDAAAPILFLSLTPPTKEEGSAYRGRGRVTAAAPLAPALGAMDEARRLPIFLSLFWAYREGWWASPKLPEEEEAAERAPSRMKALGRMGPVQHTTIDD